MTLPANFTAKTARTDCIVWVGACNSKGYGCFGVDGVSQLAHRVAWEDANGPIPEGLTIDHLCRVHNCVRVDHMELVSIAENNRRKRIAGGLRIGGECIRGHALSSPADLYYSPRGATECRECLREGQRRRRATARAEATS